MDIKEAKYVAMESKERTLKNHVVSANVVQLKSPGSMSSIVRRFPFYDSFIHLELQHLHKVPGCAYVLLLLGANTCQTSQQNTTAPVCWQSEFVFKWDEWTEKIKCNILAVTRFPESPGWLQLFRPQHIDYQWWPGVNLK